MLKVSVKVQTKNTLYWFIKCQTRVNTPKGAKTSLALNETQEIGVIQILYHLWACKTSGKKLLTLYAKTTNEKIQPTDNSCGKIFWRNVGTCDNQQCNLKEMGQTMQLFYD
jgi:hypothetical protein